MEPYSALSAYKAASNMTSSLGAVVMLYDGMIKEVNKAKVAIEEGRIEDRFNATQKACQILLGLQSHLDFENGGDISLMLDQFYHTIFRDLQQVNMSNSAKACDEVANALGEVRASWAELAKSERQAGQGAGSDSQAAKGDEHDAPQSSSVTLSI
ncbi:flagellar export chaperone FliS [Pelagibius marinus]|uniref:flagellar export chaperone FliS n=1 Tax=Pelagibius marinus TaxID=2762760 RepID=UPI001D048F85|nr:flagellar export chaperone FliS [Pelagibius marinus]